MSTIIPQKIRSENLTPVKEGDENIPLAIRLIRMEAAIAAGDIEFLIQRIGCTDEHFAYILMQVVINDCKLQSDKSKMGDKELIKKFNLQDELVLYGIRNNPEFQNIFVSLTKSAQIKSRYADIVDGVVNNVIAKGKAKDAEFILGHAGLHEKEQANNNTQINIFQENWKRQIGKIIDQQDGTKTKN